MRTKIGVTFTITKELLEGLDEFVSQFERLERSEVIETMVFYCLAHNKALNEIAEVLEGESDYSLEDKESGEVTSIGGSEAESSKEAEFETTCDECKAVVKEIGRAHV
jgi:metal-responsive CopG/Arc/MetJ family transcriptional regulator